MFKAEVPRSQHIKRLLEEQHRKRDPDLSRRVPYTPLSVSKTVHRPTPDGKRLFDEAVHGSVSRTNVHKHSFTCHKGPSGKTHCRMAYGKTLSETSKPVQIKFAVEEEEKETKTN